MDTIHKIINKSSINMAEVKDNSVDLVVTSPPYPMIEMWDDCFKEQNCFVKQSFDLKMYHQVWLEMNYFLERVWKEVVRVVKPGGFVCINMGDATRTFEGNFQLYPNHIKVIEYFIENGFSCLPLILWEKRTNSPNKFMGSGMLPSGAYVTLEHEYIMIFRKGYKREFSESEKLRRQESAYFYNERNEWFSDTWKVMGTSQKGVKGSRDRNGSYPLDIPYRLINMYSMKNDVVLDPFAGLGTTMLAAIALGRNSINYEIDNFLCDYMIKRVQESFDIGLFKELIENRLEKQRLHILQEKEKGKDKFYFNSFLNIDVKTKQEQNILFSYVDNLEIKKNKIIVRY